MFGIGIFELLILAIIALPLIVLVIVAAVVGIVAYGRRERPPRD